MSNTPKSSRRNQPIIGTHNSGEDADSVSDLLDNDSSHAIEDKGAAHKRRKRKSEGLTTVSCKIARPSLCCCLHIDRHSKEDPKPISADTLSKLSEVFSFLKPLNGKQLQSLGPQAAEIRRNSYIVK